MHVHIHIYMQACMHAPMCMCVCVHKHINTGAHNDILLQSFVHSHAHTITVHHSDTQKHIYVLVLLYFITVCQLKEVLANKLGEGKFDILDVTFRYYNHSCLLMHAHITTSMINCNM